MLGFKELKNILIEEITRLQNRMTTVKRDLTNFRNIKSMVNDYVNSGCKEINHLKLLQLKGQIPQVSGLCIMLQKIDRHQQILAYKSLDDFDFNELITDAKECAKLCGFPSKKVIENFEDSNEAIEKAKSFLSNKYKIKNINKAIEETVMLNIKEKIKLISDYLANKIMVHITQEVKNQDEEDLVNELESIKERIKLIQEFNKKFTNDILLSKFESDEELESFKDLIKSLFNSSEYEEIMEMVLAQQNKKDSTEKEVKVSFDNLDMSLFTDKEVEIIEELRKIIENEGLGKESSIFSDEVNFDNRFSAYQKASIKDILLDINNCVLNNIYENKNEVIRIFEYAIKLYQKNTIRIVRENRYKELLRIRDDFLNIVSFINRTYINKEKAYDEEQRIGSKVKSINEEYIPTLEELINIDYQDDEDYDDMLDTIIINFKAEIKRWKKEMTAYYEDNPKEEDIKENTDNLVFCLEDDIDLSQEGYQNEFQGTVMQLEVKSSMELKRISGRKGMSQIWKSTETNKRKNFIEYLEQKKKIKLHFTPYRYSSDANYRTGLIKFETSAIVKEFLEKRYGLSKQSACYGIFDVISAVHADHSEYSYLEEYVMDKYLEIEELARLLISDKPDFELLTQKIDSMLAIKKEKLKMISNNNSK